MRAIVLVLSIIGIGILGCTQASATPTLSPTSTSAAVPTATVAPSPTSTTTPVPTTTATTVPPTATATSLPTATTTPEPLFLVVTEPQADSVVNSSPISVAGSTTPDAVVSINGEAVEVDIDGAFSAQVILEEGPNSIEVVASNLQGEQGNVILALIYLP